MKKTAKLLATAMLCMVSAAAYARAVYLECEAHETLERYVSHGDCVMARTEHNRMHHGGYAIARCQARRR